MLLIPQFFSYTSGSLHSEHSIHTGSCHDHSCYTSRSVGAETIVNYLYNSFLTVVLFVIISLYESSLYITQPKLHHLIAILRVAYVPILRTDPIDLIGREQMDQPDQPTLDHPLITPLVMVLVHSAFEWYSF